MIGRVGDASGERILVDHLNHLRDVLINHGGQEIKPTGDGLMVAFRSSLDAINVRGRDAAGCRVAGPARRRATRV